ncbi:hypothetical protein GGTG_10526 [Gaeumannomyces tritici R3-111a-1]|uniref:Uncharacterized protein n=1 Tax=Gaeumannomyces tritici (strain R3-111a-1) TaxID=644352 RepID=J3PAK1_GAET3|nr:hypothetical protein GGTG_10526 [Gaeumannomyces tritici R3-111a-1]EJT71267.1 hypothetical protein GGTG_10526 [Gaeumannomyces tritici R3-111a-1]
MDRCEMEKSNSEEGKERNADKTTPTTGWALSGEEIGEQGIARPDGETAPSKGLGRGLGAPPAAPSRPCARVRPDLAALVPWLVDSAKPIKGCRRPTAGAGARDGGHAMAEISPQPQPQVEKVEKTAPKRLCNFAPCGTDCTPQTPSGCSPSSVVAPPRTQDPGGLIVHGSAREKKLRGGNRHKACFRDQMERRFVTFHAPKNKI